MDTRGAADPLRKPGFLATEKNIEQEVSETYDVLRSAPAWGRAGSSHLEPSVES